MRVLLITPQSQFVDEAHDLEAKQQVRVQLIEADGPVPDLDLNSGDQVLLEDRLTALLFKLLLDRCKEGQLGDLRLLVESELPALSLVGLRSRPWLRGVHITSNFSAGPVPSVLPAPLIAVSGIKEILADWGPPPIDYDEQPCRFPLKIQIQTTTACDAKCSFCPKSSLPDERRQMTEELFNRIIAECRREKPDLIELYFHGEPLLDDRLEIFCTRTKNHCPDSLVAIITGLTSLSADRAGSLAASGLDVMFVSVNTPGEFSEIMLTKMLESVARSQDIFQKHDKQLVVVTLGNLHDRQTAALYQQHCARLGLTLESFRATSRIGDARLDRYFCADDRPPQRLCERPFTKAYIRYNGDVVLCCEDWHYQRVLGNVKTSSLSEIWNGPDYLSVRRELLDKQPKHPCDRCDYVTDAGDQPC